MTQGTERVLNNKEGEVFAAATETERRRLAEVFEKKSAGQNGDRLPVIDNLAGILAEPGLEIRPADMAALEKAAKFDIRSDKDARVKRAAKHFEEIKDGLLGFDRILKLKNVITEFIDNNQDKIKEFILPRIADDRVAECLLPNLNLMKSNLKEIAGIARKSDFKIIGNNDFIENLKHAEAIMIASINCALRKENEIKLAELGGEIGDAGAEIETEKLELYGKERERAKNYSDSIRYEDKIEKNFPSIVSDLKRFNVYLKKCAHDPGYLKQQLCNLERSGEMYKLDKKK